MTFLKSYESFQYHCIVTYKMFFLTDFVTAINLRTLLKLRHLKGSCCTPNLSLADERGCCNLSDCIVSWGRVSWL